MAEEEVVALAVVDGRRVCADGFAGDECTSRYVPFDCRQAQDARHHGRYGPGGTAMLVTRCRASAVSSSIPLRTVTTVAACARLDLRARMLLTLCSLRLSVGTTCRGIMFGMEAHASDCDSSWLSNELQIDPIIDDPMSFAQGPAFVTVHMLTRHILAITLCGALASVSVAFKKGAQGWTRAVRVPCAPGARAADALSCVCSCVTLPSQVHGRQISSTSSSRSGRASLVSSCQGKTHLEEFRLRIGIWRARCVRAEGSRSLA